MSSLLGFVFGALMNDLETMTTSPGEALRGSVCWDLQRPAGSMMLKLSPPKVTLNLLCSSTTTDPSAPMNASQSIVASAVSAGKVTQSVFGGNALTESTEFIANLRLAGLQRGLSLWAGA